MVMELNEAPELVLSALGKVKAKRCCIGFWTCGTKVLPLNTAANTINTLTETMQHLIKTRAERSEFERVNILARELGQQVKTVIEYVEQTLTDQNLTDDYRTELNKVLVTIRHGQPDETTRLIMEDGGVDSSETRQKESYQGNDML